MDAPLHRQSAEQRVGIITAGWTENIRLPDSADADHAAVILRPAATAHLAAVCRARRQVAVSSVLAREIGAVLVSPFAARCRALPAFRVANSKNRQQQKSRRMLRS